MYFLATSFTNPRTLQECRPLSGIEQISRRFGGRSEDGTQFQKLARSESGDSGAEIAHVFQSPGGEVTDGGEGHSGQFLQIIPGRKSFDCNIVYITQLKGKD